MGSGLARRQGREGGWAWGEWGADRLGAGRGSAGPAPTPPPGARGRAQSFQVRTGPGGGQRRRGPLAGVQPPSWGPRKGPGGGENRRPRGPVRERAHSPGPRLPANERGSAQPGPRRAPANERAHSPRPRPRGSHASHVRPLGGRPKAGPAEPGEQTSNCLMNIDAEARLLS